jgi:SlyX protein
MSDNDARLLEIESKIAFQEHLLESLNEALTDQQRQIEALRRQLKQMHHLMESSRDGERHPKDEPPPPHY